MAKVDWITWKTEPKELINGENIKTDINKRITEFNTIIDNIYSNIKEEMDKGGLNKDALSINGESPNSVSANKVLTKIEVLKETTNKLTNKIVVQVEEQKEIEKKQLITAIEEKIAEQEKILENTKALKDRVAASNSLINSNDVNNIIIATNEKITILKERLERAKAI